MSAKPETTATTGVPNGLIMSTPSCLRPPGRGAPNESPNALGPATGQIHDPPVITGSGAGSGGGGSVDGVGSGFGEDRAGARGCDVEGVGATPLPRAWITGVEAATAADAMEACAAFALASRSAAAFASSCLCLAT